MLMSCPNGILQQFCREIECLDENPSNLGERDLSRPSTVSMWIKLLERLETICEL